MQDRIEQFCAAATAVGATIHRADDRSVMIDVVRSLVDGVALLPASPLTDHLDLVAPLAESGATICSNNLRTAAPKAVVGITGVDFALADTGTIAIRSTDEAIRLTTTLTSRHIALLDPAVILADAEEAIPQMEAIHREEPAAFVAWITGPSRTADIERVLTIGVHGPAELHIILTPGIAKGGVQ